MYTVCPGCSRQFRLFAEHIAAANGEVRCGFCMEQFNAVGRLHDEPVPNVDLPDQSEADEEPQFDIPGVPESEVHIPTEEDVISELEIELEPESEQSDTVDDNKIRLIVDEVVHYAVEKDHEDNADEVAIDPEAERYDYAEELLGPELTQKNKSLGWLWFTASFIGVCVLVAQLAWFNRDQVLTKYPELIPYAKQMCEKLQCNLVRQRNAKQIKLVNRDVRLHPYYQDALLVNATMENELSVRQAYPRVQLTLFDTSGSLLGFRSFTPEDYLDDSIDIKEGMPAGLPVHFVLEVSGPTAGAVSFEFRFL